jgi:UMF1 family MFS transporter
MLFDWAAQPYHTLITAFIFAPYFATVLVGHAVEGQKLWGIIQGMTGLAVALAAPILGSVADRTGRLKLLVLAVSAVYVAASSALWAATPGAIVLAGAGVALAGFAVEIAAVLTNALLPRLAAPGRMGKLSGSAWALGFVGGLVSLAATLAFLSPAGSGAATLAGLEPLFGLDPSDGGPARATGPLAAIWYVVFAAPFFIFVPSSLAAVHGPAPPRLLDALERLSRAPGLARFLLARLAFQDALLAVFAFGGIYGAGVLGWETTELGIFGILLTVTGAIGAWLGGRIDDRVGPRPVVIGSILLNLAALALIGLVEAPAQEPTSLFGRGEDRLFLLAGVLVGIAAGPLQASSRTYLARLAPAEEMAAAFGLFAFSGKAVSFTGPLLVSLATHIGGTQGAGLVPIAVLFVIGLAVLASVPPAR